MKDGKVIIGVINACNEMIRDAYEDYSKLAEELDDDNVVLYNIQMKDMNVLSIHDYFENVFKYGNEDIFIVMVDRPSDIYFYSNKLKKYKDEVLKEKSSIRVYFLYYSEYEIESVDERSISDWFTLQRDLFNDNILLLDSCQYGMVYNRVRYVCDSIFYSKDYKDKYEEHSEKINRKYPTIASDPSKEDIKIKEAKIGYEDKPKIEYTKQTVWIVCKDGKFDTSTQEVYLEYIENNQISEPSTLLIDHKDLFGMTIDDFNVKNTHIVFNVTSYDEYKKSALFMTNLREKYKGFDNFKIFIQVFESMITTRSSINGINLNTISDINKSPLAQFISYAVNED